MGLDPIFLPQLARAPEQTDVMAVHVSFPNLDLLTPVQGQIKVVHHGNYLQVDAQAETIVTLTCDRCLQHYNHRLVTAASELIWLQEATPDDLLEGVTFTEDLEDPSLTETLSPEGYFYPEDWLYQQLCLALPQRQLCSVDCPGIAVMPNTEAGQSFDQRWAILADLKRQLGNDGL